jgi:hypothetical protein
LSRKSKNRCIEIYYSGFHNRWPLLQKLQAWAEIDLNSADHAEFFLTLKNIVVIKKSKLSNFSKEKNSELCREGARRSVWQQVGSPHNGVPFHNTAIASAVSI